LFKDFFNNITPNRPFENQSSIVLRLAFLVQEPCADPIYDPGGRLFRIGE